MITPSITPSLNAGSCNVLRFMLIRHGEALTNLNEGRIGGRINPSPLTLRGERQAHLTGRYLGQIGLKFDCVCSSHAVRAIHTAEIITSYTGFDYKKIFRTEKVAEIDRGSWTALPRKPLVTPKVAADMERHPLTWKAPGGESLLDVRKRMMDFICVDIVSAWKEGREKERKTHDNRKTPFTVGIFTHNTAIKCFLQGMSTSNKIHASDFQIDNCSMTEVLYYPKLNSWKLSKINFLPPRPKL